MTTLILDAGALIGIDRADRDLVAILDVATRSGVSLRTSAIIVAQVWRDGARQARLARALRAIEVVAINEERAREIGQLLGAAATSDAADAALVSLARPGDQVLTSDPNDITHLLAAADVSATVVPC